MWFNLMYVEAKQNTVKIYILNRVDNYIIHYWNRIADGWCCYVVDQTEQILNCDARLT